jgi:hypothetical protein
MWTKNGTGEQYAGPLTDGPDTANMYHHSTIQLPYIVWFY